MSVVYAFALLFPMDMTPPIWPEARRCIQTRNPMIKKMGSIEQIMGMIPGLNKMKQAQNMPKPDERELVRTEAIINSMTRVERRNYQIINASRRQRIAGGSGTSVQDVNRVIKSYSQMLKMMKKMKGFPGGMAGGKKKRKLPKGLRR